MNDLTRQLIAAAVHEDLDAAGDLTSLYFIDASQIASGDLVAREPLVLSGTEVAAGVVRAIDPAVTLTFSEQDGFFFETGSVIGTLGGKARSLLTIERTLLNFIQRLCAIATETRRYQDLVSHTKAKVLDTRKTTPGWRELEKAAVRHGGGINHRFGLYDAVMLKDNHLVACSDDDGINHNIERLHAGHPGVRVHIEADTVEQVGRFLALTGVDSILLDNMSHENLRAAVALRNQSGKDVSLEASGGITDETIRAVAETGVDFISVGALTHSVRSRDIGLDFR